MISLLYTGSDNPNEEQMEPTKSLGGFISSTEVPNDFFSNLFGEITNNSLLENNVEHICLAIKTNSNLENLIITANAIKQSIGRFRVAAVKGTMDNCGVFKLPKMQNIFSKPSNLKFYNFTSFYGETKIGFNINPIEGEEIKIYSNNEHVGTIFYDEFFKEIYIENDFVDDFSFDVRYNYEQMIFELYLIQKDINNFDPAIEVIRESDQSEIGNIENQLPSENFIQLGNLTEEEVLGIYIERSFTKEAIKETKALNCKKMFVNYNTKIEPITTEEIELYIDYNEL